MNWSDKMRPAQTVMAIMLAIVLILNGSSVVWAQDTLAINQEGPNWVLIILRIMSIAAIVLAIVIDVNLVIGAIQWQQRRYQKKAQVEIENLGNTLSPYRLRAEHPSGDLQFRLLFEEVELEYESTQTILTEPEPPLQEKKQKAAAQHPSATKATMKDVQAKAAQARGISYFISNLLGTIASILPSSMAAPLRNIVSQMRQKQAAASRIERAPRRVTQKAGQTRRLFKKKPSSKPKKAKEASQPSTLFVTEKIWSETPEVGPGESMVFELLINPTQRPSQTQDYAITVMSQVMGIQDPPKISETYNVTIEKVTWIRHVLPFILIALLFITEIVLIWFLVTNTGLVGS